MSDQPTHVQVEIFGQTYTIRAGADPGYVEKLAARVDAEMREVSRLRGAVDSVRIAVLAALNIADEGFRLQQEVAACEAREKQLQEQVRQAEARAKELAARSRDSETFIRIAESKEKTAEAMLRDSEARLKQARAEATAEQAEARARAARLAEELDSALRG